MYVFFYISMRIEDTFCKGKNSMSLLFQYKEGKNRSLTGPGGYPRETCSSYRSSAFFGMHSDTFGWSEWWMLTLLLLFLYVFWVFRYFFIIIISYNCILNWKFYAKFLSKYQKSQHYFDIIHFNIHQERGPRISTGGIYKVRPRGFTLILHNMYVCTYDPIWTKRSNGVWNKQCTVSLMSIYFKLC